MGNKKCKKCDCGNSSMEIKTPYLKSNDEWNLLHKRNKFELWVDKYNHTLEFTRTIVQILVFFAQIVVLWKLFS